MKPPTIKADLVSITQRVERCAALLDVALGPEVTEKMVQWIELVITWSRKIDLTAARTIDELVDLCVSDAFVLGRQIKYGGSVVDVGSGAGAPGLALALARPDLDVTLVEPLAKRVAFLRTVTGTLKVRVPVRRARGEDLIGGKKWGIAISRATLEPSTWLGLGFQLCDESEGQVAVFLARHAPPRMEPLIECEATSYRWPLTNAKRTIAWYRRA